MKRMTLAATMILLVIGLAVTAGETLGQKPGKGKPGGGGGGDTEPNWVTLLTIHDDHPGAQLLSDEQERQDPTVPENDEDLDSFGDLASMSGLGSYFYLDHRVLLTDGNGALTGPYADPCADFDLSTESSPGRTRLSFSRRLSDSSRCDLSTNPDYTNDVRTISLVFDKGDTADPSSGGSCACDKLAYLVNADGSPATMYGGEIARTSFVDSDPDDPSSGTCALGLAAGAIVWPDDSGNIFADSAIPRIEAWPFEDLHTSKRDQRRSGQSVDGKTDVRFDFHTDVKNLGDGNRWELNSQGEIVPTAAVGDDEREIIASGQAFDLTGPDHLFPNGGQCSDVSMTFKLTVKRIDLNGSQ